MWMCVLFCMYIFIGICSSYFLILYIFSSIILNNSIFVVVIRFFKLFLLNVWTKNTNFIQLYIVGYVYVFLLVAGWIGSLAHGCYGLAWDGSAGGVAYFFKLFVIPSLQYSLISYPTIRRWSALLHKMCWGEYKKRNLNLSCCWSWR